MVPLIAPQGETLEELQEDLRWYLRALQAPVLEDVVFRQTSGGLFGDDAP